MQHRSDSGWGRLHTALQRLGVLLALVSQFSGKVTAETVELPGERIRLRGIPQTEIQAWKRFASGCAAEVVAVMGRDAKAGAFLTIRVSDTATTSERDPLRIQVAADENIAVLTQRVVQGLLARYVIDREEGKVPVTPSRAWIAAGITHRILFGNRESRGFFEPNYQPARFRFVAGRFPRVVRLVTVPVPASESQLYRLYAMHSDILLHCLEAVSAAGSSAVLQLLELESHGREPAESLRFVVGIHLASGEDLQAWYEREAAAVSRRGRRESRVAQVEERLESLVTVPMVTPGRGGIAVQRVPLEEMSARIDAYRLDQGALRQLQVGIFELFKDAPVLLQDPLAEYMKAFELLAEGKTRQFTRQIRRARSEFTACAARQRRLEQYLDEQERELVPAGARFSQYLEAIETYEARRRQVALDLHDYLDRLNR